MTARMDLGQLIKPLQEEYKYISQLMDSRNEFKHKAIDIGISTVLKHIEQDRSVYEIAEHGIRPLQLNCRKLLRSTESTSLNEIKTRLTEKRADDLLKMIDQTLILAKQVLTSINLDKIEGKWQSYRNNPQKLETRFAKLIAHCIHHLGQATIFHGLLCSNLANS